ncbi:MAG TPA: exodeoxyribonuclease V subunit alpha [Chthoniobacterales bacterium]|nr:exodeoxyribonuclease V subunit alpha [Chthoniobacterales bacterium]
MATPELEIDFIDQHFAALMNRLAKVPSPELELAAKLVSNFRARGDVCVPLRNVTATEAGKLGSTEVPALKNWVKKLRSSGVVGDPGEFAPLILDQSDRLYLQRYWKYEDELGRNLQARLGDKSPRDFDAGDLVQGIAELFPGPSDLQKVAAFVAATSRLCVISGAPGTGKTRTIVLICALLIRLAAKRELTFALAAPTGKAAARLKETIAQTGMSLRLPGDLKLPADASTIQRLLGARGDSPHFRHKAKNPLTADVVIVDEASMIDLALLAKLFDAIRPDARIILVGDKDQLASVEAGSAFRDICTPGFELGVSVSLAEAFAKSTGEKLDGTRPDQAPIHSVVVELRRNYRFTPGAGIGELSSAVNRGDAEGAIAVLKSGGSIRWRPAPSLKNFERELRECVFPRFEKLLRLSDPAVALKQLAEFAVLCALRRGPFGVETVNALLEGMLRETGLIEVAGRYHAGEPIIIVRNDYNVGLFNGDLGIVLPDAITGELRVFFRGEEDEVLNFAPGRLPAHEPAFALTVHKSQGSEFHDALVILPERDAPVLTRELLYTGITRVRETVEVWASEEILRQTIERKIARSSGLRDRLWKEPTV